MTSSSYYKSILFTLLVLALASCGAKKSTVTDKNARLQKEIIDYSKKYLHKPYRYAGKGPYSFDCSGYTSFVFSKFGYKLNSSSAGQARQGTAINKKEELQVGDLVFFEGRSLNGRVGHVGIVSDIGKKGQFKFIHASTSNGVIITSSEEPYYRTRYLRGGRILKDIPKIPKEPETEESTLVENNYAKAKENVTYKETDDGFVTIHTGASSPAKETTAVTSEQASKPSKPVKSKEQEEEEDKKKKKNSEFRQAAIRGSEESPIALPTRISHKVKPGETLYSISQLHNCSVDELRKWNPELENNTLQAGDVLDVYQ